MSTAPRRQSGLFARDGGEAGPVPLLPPFCERGEEVIAQQGGERQRCSQLLGRFHGEGDVLEAERHAETRRLELRSGDPRRVSGGDRRAGRSEEHTSELQSHSDLVCRLLLEKKKQRRASEQ